MPIRLIDCLVFNANFSSISAILWCEKENSSRGDFKNTSMGGPFDKSM